MIGRRRASWDKALDLVAKRFATPSRAMAPTASPSTSRASAHRGLLRRQQADVGVHRLGEHRHQFAPVHVERGGGADPRLWRGCGAGELRRYRRRRPDRAGRQQHRPGAIRSSISVSGALRRRCETGRDRPAPHRDGGTGRSAPRHPTGQRCGADERRARLGTAAGVVDEAFLAASVAVPEDFWTALDQGSDLWSVAKTCDVAPGDLRRFYEMFAATPHTVTLFSQGIKPVDRRHRPGQCDPQPAPRHRPDRQAGGRALLDHRPAQCDGRSRGRRARLDAGGAYGFRARQSRAVQRSGPPPPSRPGGLKAVDCSAKSARGGSRRCGSWRPTPPCRCPMRVGARRARRLPLRGGQRRDRGDGYVVHAHVRLPASPGREGRHRQPTATARSAASARFPPARRREADWWIVKEVAAAWAGRPPSPMTGRPRSGASIAACPPMRMTAPACSRCLPVERRQCGL